MFRRLDCNKCRIKGPLILLCQIISVGFPTTFECMLVSFHLKLIWSLNFEVVLRIDQQMVLFFIWDPAPSFKLNEIQTRTNLGHIPQWKKWCQIQNLSGILLILFHKAKREDLYLLMLLVTKMFKNFDCVVEKEKLMHLRKIWNAFFFVTSCVRKDFGLPFSVICKSC